MPLASQIKENFIPGASTSTSSWGSAIVRKTLTRRLAFRRTSSNTESSTYPAATSTPVHLLPPEVAMEGSKHPQIAELIDYKIVILFNV